MATEKETEDKSGVSLSQGTIVAVFSALGVFIVTVFWLGYNWNITSTSNKLTPKLNDRLDTFEIHMVHGFVRVNKRIDDILDNAKEAHKIDSIKEAVRLEEHRKEVDISLQMYQKTNKAIEVIKQTK